MPPDGGPRTPAVMHCIIAVQGEAQLTEPVAEMSGLDRRSTAWPVTGGTAEAPPGSPGGASSVLLGAVAVGFEPTVKLPTHTRF